MKLRKLALIALGVAMLGFAVPVHAQTNFGGNNAADYQPPTRNPQGNVATGIQNNKANLQPTNTQAGINQQNLPVLPNLQVVTTNQRGAPSTASEPSKKPSNFWKYFLMDIAAFAILLAIARYWQTHRKTIKKEVATEKPIEIIGPAVNKAKKTKKKKSPPQYKRKSRKK